MLVSHKIDTIWGYYGAWNTSLSQKFNPILRVYLQTEVMGHPVHTGSLFPGETLNFIGCTKNQGT